MWFKLAAMYKSLKTGLSGGEKRTKEHDLVCLELTYNKVPEWEGKTVEGGDGQNNNKAAIANAPCVPH